MSTSGPYRLSRYLLGGVNFRYNFMGLGTFTTAFYGIAEVGIKVAPLLATLYGIKYATTHYTPDRNQYLDEVKIQEKPAEIRRTSF